MQGDQPEPVTPPVGGPEPEVRNLVPLEPEQVLRVLMNRVVGQTISRIVSYVAPSDGKQRYILLFGNGTGLLFQPLGPDRIFLTFVERMTDRPDLPGGQNGDT